MVKDVRGVEIQVGDTVITYAPQGKGVGLYHAEVVKVNPKTVMLALCDGPVVRPCLKQYSLRRYVTHYKPLTTDPKKIVVWKSAREDEANDKQLEQVREAAWNLGYEAGYETGRRVGES